MALTFAVLPAGSISAQTYPSRNITFVVGFAAGGVADSVGRIVAQKLSDRLGQTVVVENRGGAGGNIAAKSVVGSVADGYTVLVTTTALAINETLHRNKGFTTDDFKTVAIAASSPESLSVPPTTQANNIGEFLKTMQGKSINFGSAGTGSGSHIAAEYFLKEIAKVSATHVPFQGGAPAMNAALAGHIDLLARRNRRRWRCGADKGGQAQGYRDGKREANCGHTRRTDLRRRRLSKLCRLLLGRLLRP